MEDIRREIAGMADECTAWLAKRTLHARTVTIKVRYADFETVTRSHTAEASRDPEAFRQRALALLAKTAAGSRPVRLLGVSVHNLCDSDAPAATARPRRDTGLPRLPFDDGEDGGPASPAA
jgi:DNA polymerase-4